MRNNSPSPRRRWRPIGQSRFLPRLERLEERETPAPMVHASFAGGLLTLTGIDKTAQVDVLAKANDQHIAINGTGAGSFTVSGVGTTTIDGAAFKSFTKVTGIRIDLRLGDDIVEVNSADLSGNLTFLAGSGNDSITFGAVAGNQAFGSVSLNGGEGTDASIFTGGATKIGGALNILHADGFCAVTLNTLPTDQLTAGSIHINGGAALTNVSASGGNLTVHGATSISGGSGQTTLVSTATTLEGNLSVTRKHAGFINLGAFGTTVVGRGVTLNSGAGPSIVAFAGSSYAFTGNVSIVGGDGLSNIQLGNLNVVGNLTIHNGPGDSTTKFTAGNSKITGNFALINGDGHDDLSMSLAATVEITGALTVNNGPGGGDISLTPATKLIVGGALTVTCGSGFDSVTIGETGEQSFLKRVTISYGSGGSQTNFASSLNTLDGPLSVSGANALNMVTFANTTNCKGLSIATGGTSVIQVLGPTTVSGNLNITSGSGDDVLNFVQSLDVTGSVNINMGDGQDFLDWNTKAASIGAGLTIRGGDDADVIDLGLLAVGGATLIDAGANHDSIRINDSGFGGAVHLIAGSGNDQVLIETNDTGSVSGFGNAFTVALGSGDDTIQIGLAADVNDWAAFGGAVSIQGGTDLDRASLLPPAKGGSRLNTFAVNPVFIGVEIVE